MSCPTLSTGNRFLVDALGHLDCQAQTLGSFGFQALSAPGSPASLALGALLTLFIALFGVRMLFGSGVEPHDGVSAMLKIGIVLTLAVSWPAFRILAYDTVLKGPAEVAASITPSTLPDSRAGFAERLQNVDAGIATLTVSGAGRQTGSLALVEDSTGSFRSIAMEDESALGWARVLFLGSVIGSVAALRLGGGMLLALTPLFAGLLLFETTRGLFAGWLRGLVLIAIGSLAVTLVLTVEVALIEPWLADTLNRRNLGYATPTAPTELLALTLAFSVALAAIMFLLTKVAFQNAWSGSPIIRLGKRPHPPLAIAGPAAVANTEIPIRSRALALSESVSATLRREDRQLDYGSGARRIGMLDRGRDAPVAGTAGSTAVQPLGSGYRRSLPRATAAQARRDREQ